MPDKKSIKVYSVFLASPDDVSNERNRVSKVIEKINRFFEHQNIQFNLIRWEAMRPGYGESAQDVIESQISQDYDIFVGIMWLTTGSSDSSESGTIQEYSAAKKRSDEGESVEIFFYFKEQPLETLSEINAHDLVEVQKFKFNFGKQGLYKSFVSTKEFEELLEQNLLDYIKDLSDKEKHEQINTTPSKVDDPENANDEIGLFDLFESISTNSDKLVSNLSNITKFAEDSIKKLNQRTAEIEALNEDTKNFSITKLQRILNAAADDLNHFCNQMRRELPDFRSYLESFVNISHNLLITLKSINGDKTTQLEKQRISLTYLVHMMQQTEIAYVKAMDSVSKLPSTTTQLNKARRRTVMTFERLISIFRNGIMKLELILMKTGDSVSE